MLSEKGKYASATENRRFVWKEIVWPLILQVSDAEFMADDIGLWKSVQPEIHRDELMRCYQGVKLMTGARELIDALQARGVIVAIVSAGVDLLIGSIAKMLNVDDWVSNGFQYDENGYLLDDGEVRVPAHHKDSMVEKFARINNLKPSEIVSIGDNHTDMSMRIPGSGFIGFNGQKQIAIDGFAEAGVPHVQEKDCRLLWPHIFEGESFPAIGGE